MDLDLHVLPFSSKEIPPSMYTPMALLWSPVFEAGRLNFGALVLNHATMIKGILNSCNSVVQKWTSTKSEIQATEWLPILTLRYTET